MISFLLEFLSKNEEEDGKNESAPSQQFDVLLKRRLLRWTQKPWVLPEFLEAKKQLYIGGGDSIVVRQDLDAERIAQCKSKKAKGVYAMMEAMKGAQYEERYAQGSSLLAKGIQDKTQLKLILQS